MRKKIICRLDEKIIDFNLDLGFAPSLESMKPRRYCDVSRAEISLETSWSIRHTSPLISGRNHWSNARPSSHLEVGIFHLFSKADPLSNLCGLRLLDRLIHYGFHSTVGIWLNYERYRGGAKSKETRFELLKCLSDQYKPWFFFFYGRQKTPAYNSKYYTSELVANL